MKSKIFISFSRKDAAYAELLASLLKERGYETWAKTDASIEVGDSWDKEASKALNDSDLFISLISEDYLDSGYSLVEWGTAYGSGKKVIPILLSGEMSDLPLRFRQFRMIDAQKTDKDSLLKLIEQQTKEGLAA